MSWANPRSKGTALLESKNDVTGKADNVHAWRSARTSPLYLIATANVGVTGESQLGPVRYESVGEVIRSVRHGMFGYVRGYVSRYFAGLRMFAF